MADGTYLQVEGLGVILLALVVVIVLVEVVLVEVVFVEVVVTKAIAVKEAWVVGISKCQRKIKPLRESFNLEARVFVVEI